MAEGRGCLASRIPEEHTVTPSCNEEYAHCFTQIFLHQPEWPGKWDDVARNCENTNNEREASAMLLNIMRTTLSVSEELHRATKLHSFPHDLLQQPAFTHPHYKYPNLILLFIASHFTANKFISNCREASGCSLPTPIDILTALICTSSIGLRCLPQPHTSMQKHRANKHFQQLPKYPPF